MGIITKVYSFGNNLCLNCDKELKKKRKWKYVCSDKCQKKYIHKINTQLNLLSKHENGGLWGIV